MFGREKIAKIVVEFMGTAVLTSVVLSTSVRLPIPYFSAAAAGFTLALMVLVIGPISGAHINPAVTIGQWTLRKISTLEAVAYVTAQMLGGLVAWRLIEWFLGAPLKNIAGQTFSTQVLVGEVLGALVFTFGIAAAIKRGYDNVASAITIGASLFIGILVASLASNGVLNPAVAVGIQSWSLSYALGPIIGAILGMNLYVLLTEPLYVKKAKATTAKASPKKAIKKPAKKR